MSVARSASDLSDRVPPQDLDAERSVLGSVLLANDVLDDVISVIQSRHFYSDPHQKIFQAIHDMYEDGIRGIDAVTLGHELQKRGELEAVGGPAYLVQILETVPHAAHAEYYAKIVREKWLQRSLIDACTESLREAYHGSDAIEEILTRSEKRIFSIAEPARRGSTAWACGTSSKTPSNASSSGWTRKDPSAASRPGSTAWTT